MFFYGYIIISKNFRYRRKVMKKTNIKDKVQKK